MNVAKTTIIKCHIGLTVNKDIKSGYPCEILNYLSLECEIYVNRVGRNSICCPGCIGRGIARGAETCSGVTGRLNKDIRYRRSKCMCG